MKSAVNNAAWSCAFLYPNYRSILILPTFNKHRLSHFKGSTLSTSCQASVMAFVENTQQSKVHLSIRNSCTSSSPVQLAGAPSSSQQYSESLESIPNHLKFQGLHCKWNRNIYFYECICLEMQLHKVVAKLQETNKGWWFCRINIQSGAGAITSIFYAPKGPIMSGVIKRKLNLELENQWCC